MSAELAGGCGEGPHYETRGCECLSCAFLDLKGHPEQALGGFGTCRVKNVFVAFYCARNCADYERAPEELVNGREAWNAKRKTVP